MLGIYISIWFIGCSRTSWAETWVWNRLSFVSCIKHGWCIHRESGFWQSVSLFYFMLCEIAFALCPAANFTNTLTDLLCDVLKWFILGCYELGIVLKKHKHSEPSLLWFYTYPFQNLFFTFSSSGDNFSLLLPVWFCPSVLPSQILLMFLKFFSTLLFSTTFWK